MTIVKSKLRTTMTQKRLDSLMLLFVEQHKTNYVDIDEGFTSYRSVFCNKCAECAAPEVKS
ncbi:zinc finger MYM-type protein 1-like [Aphis craccivora]|uniref:Zinc finger MYM-type protein 1-like n=1 Tax=Aphis craccivora TaxID=307492 RepID=A0A6G0VM99_APHCR|nr:zinc finger MYM-type protein 1-like [Aphis craccivora]